MDGLTNWTMVLPSGPTAGQCLAEDPEAELLDLAGGQNGHILNHGCTCPCNNAIPNGKTLGSHPQLIETPSIEA